ncbi:MAG: major facilitator superfamily 1 [Deltaproteobacteria bacterium]|nr:major facilitator superfamily 1 [Deltaproteobacteria bacterium]
MTPKTNSPPRPERLVLMVGGTIGLAIVGDSFLYGTLPIEAKNLGIALPLVGILLSINRLVRLLSNTWASSVFEKLGPRRPFILATVLALLTTAAYGAGWGFLVFLLARMGWGIAWSALRQAGYQAVWTGGDRAKGRLMGMLWGIIRLGSAFSVLFGGFLRDRFGYRTGVWGISAITAFAIPVALSIRWPAEPRQAPRAQASFRQGWREALQTPPGRRLLLAGFVHSAFEGILISTTSLFLVGRLGGSDLFPGLGAQIGTLAGFLLALRWTSDMVFGPAIGALSDRIGQARTLVLLATVLLATMLGVVGLGGMSLILCLCVLFISSAGLMITLAALASSVALRAERPHIYVGVYATAHDAGSAVGPLLAYFATGLIGLASQYLLAAVILILAIIWYRRAV